MGLADLLLNDFRPVHAGPASDMFQLMNIWDLNYAPEVATPNEPINFWSGEMNYDIKTIFILHQNEVGVIPATVLMIPCITKYRMILHDRIQLGPATIGWEINPNVINDWNTSDHKYWLTLKVEGQVDMVIQKGRTEWRQRRRY